MHSHSGRSLGSQLGWINSLESLSVVQGSDKYWKVGIVHFLGFSNHRPEVDPSAPFVTVDQLLPYHHAMNESGYKSGPNG